MSKLDEIAELLLKALAMPEPVAPDAVGFVYRRRGGEQNGVEVLVERDTRENADEEATRLGTEWGCELAYERRQPDVSPRPAGVQRTAETARRK